MSNPDVSLEERYQALLQSLFGIIRDDYYDSVLTREQAISLSEMLTERLGIEAPHSEEIPAAWSQSSWCVGG